MQLFCQSHASNIGLLRDSLVDEKRKIFEPPPIYDDVDELISVKDNDKDLVLLRCDEIDWETERWVFLAVR